MTATQFIYSSFTSCELTSIALGKSSADLYYLGKCESPSNVLIRRVDSNYTEKWSRLYVGLVNDWSLAVSDDEQYLFFTLKSISLTQIYQINATNGDLMNVYTNADYNTNSVNIDMKFHNNYLYISGRDVDKYGSL
jgi:hypothetical protein